MFAFLFGQDTHAQCVINVQSTGPFCAGESVQLSTAAGPEGTTYTWVSSCAGSLVGSNTSSPVFNLPPPSNGTDCTISLTVNAPGQAPCVAPTVTLVVDPTPQAAITASGFAPIDFNGLPTFIDCSDPESLTIDFTDACACADVTNYSIDWGNGEPDTGGAYSTWTEQHTYVNGLSTITYAVTNANSGCADVQEYGVFVGTNAIPGGSFGNTGVEPVCTGAPMEFMIDGVAGNDPGTTYTVFWGDGTSEVLGSPPVSPLFHIYTIGSCGQQSNPVTCGGFTNTNSSVNTFLPVLCIETPCNQTTPSAGAAQVLDGPVASFVTSSLEPCTDEVVTLMSTSEGHQAGPPICSPPDLTWSIEPSTGWSPSLTDDVVQTIVFTEAGDYTVQLTAIADICGSNVMAQTILVDCATDINEVGSIGSFLLTPNPTDGPCSLDRSATVPGALFIRDATGRRIKMIPVGPQTRVLFDLSDLPPGIYVLELVTRDQRSFGRVVRR